MRFAAAGHELVPTSSKTFRPLRSAGAQRGLPRSSRRLRPTAVRFTCSATRPADSTRGSSLRPRTTLDRGDARVVAAAAERHDDEHAAFRNAARELLHDFERPTPPRRAFGADRCRALARCQATRGHECAARLLARERARRCRSSPTARSLDRVDGRRCRRRAQPGGARRSSPRSRTTRARCCSSAPSRWTSWRQRSRIARASRTVAPYRWRRRPKPRRWIETVGQPWRACRSSLFFAPSPPHRGSRRRYPCAAMRGTMPSVGRRATRRLSPRVIPVALRSSANDGVVPIRRSCGARSSGQASPITSTCSGTTMMIAIRTGRTRASALDWLTSGSTSVDARFTALMDAIANGMLGARAPPRDPADLGSGLHKR